MATTPYEAIDSKASFAIFPHKGEYAVAHVGYARAYDKENFQTSWVVDTVCPTVELAVQAMDKLVAESKRRKIAELQELVARTRTR